MQVLLNTAASQGIVKRYCPRRDPTSESFAGDVMPYYRVFLEGGNFWLQMDAAPQRIGFYTTRFVEAASLDESGKAAIGLLRSTQMLKPLNHPDDPPQILVREI